MHGTHPNWAEGIPPQQSQIPVKLLHVPYPLQTPFPGQELHWILSEQEELHGEATCEQFKQVILVVLLKRIVSMEVLQNKTQTKKSKMKELGQFLL